MKKHLTAYLVTPVILCGGSGTRLWPLSRSEFPKHFLPLSGNSSNQTLFQDVITQINAIGNSKICLNTTLIVTNEEHRFLVLDQLQEVNENINAILIIEPVSRNTAPALSLAALHALNENKKDSDPIMVVTPSDQIVQNQSVYVKALQDCVEVVAEDRRKKTIAILGIKPTTPETGFGYIERNGARGINNEYKVKKFVEKPDAKTAHNYLANDDYFWNSGIFVLRASTWLTALEQFRSDISKFTDAAWRQRTEDKLNKTILIRPDKAFFTSIPAESIDYAVIEKCTTTAMDLNSSKGSEGFDLKMVELDAGWNDMGTWNSVWQAGKKDINGNVVCGDTLLVDTKNTLVNATSRLVSVLGAENFIIVETPDAVLVANKKRSQDVKIVVGYLEQHKRKEKNLHRKATRPWGWYDSIDEDKCFKVKRIMVKPGCSLSLQMHRHRAEHWIVVRGIAEIINGDKVIILSENQSTYIPQGQKHRISNPGKMPLEIIEVQTGAYLEEDDIVRFHDEYKRK